MRLGLGDESAQSEAGPLPRIVLVDANIFFAPRLRDLFMHLHEAEALSIHWTREIEDEWARNVALKGTTVLHAGQERGSLSSGVQPSAAGRDDNHRVGSVRILERGEISPRAKSHWSKYS